MLIEEEKVISDLYKRLQILLKSSFPTRCNKCGNVYHNAEEYLKKTHSIRPRKVLKRLIHENDSTMIDLFRHCSCGNVVIEYIDNRRDNSGKGDRKRELFEELVGKITVKGIAPKTAKVELRKVIQGKPSIVLKAKGFQVR